MAEDKVFSFKGKSLEELQKMSVKELSEILPSRIRRKINRGFTEQEQVFLKRVEAGEKKIKTHCRDMIVLPNMVEKKIAIYNGKEFVEILIVPDMIGFRLGELAMTRKIAVHTTMGAKKNNSEKIKMAYNYSYQKYDKETMARAHSTNVAISLKKTVETAKFIQGKKVSSAIKALEGVMDKKVVVPYRKYRAEIGHKRGAGIDTGGYPIKVAEELLRLVKAASKNASEKELGENLYVISVSGRKAVGRYHNGRHMGRKMKSTNVEIVVGEKKKND